jgi:hypothetical protein
MPTGLNPRSSAAKESSDERARVDASLVIR